jgi:DNA-binding HxlR family transcriptional regulator
VNALKSKFAWYHRDMPREYDQACSLACALDRIGERWSLLIVRELSLGPLRFSDLARSVGGAPTDVLTKRLRDLEEHGVVRRRELDPPASASVYELTELGRGLEQPMLELGRWGLNFETVDEVVHLAPTSLPNAVRVILRPPADATLTLGLRSGGQAYRLRVEDGWIEASRGEAASADVTLAGTPSDVLATLIVGEAGEGEVEVEGDRKALEALRAMVVLPDRLREEALAFVGPRALAA